MVVFNRLVKARTDNKRKIVFRKKRICHSVVGKFSGCEFHVLPFDKHPNIAAKCNL